MSRTFAPSLPLFSLRHIWGIRSRLQSTHADYILLRDFEEKSSAFDSAAASFTLSSAAA